MSLIAASSARIAVSRSRARSEPRDVASIAMMRVGTAMANITSAVPRAEPFITAGPPRRFGTKKVATPVTVATIASAPESQ
jgi:hypothetical protein